MTFATSALSTSHREEQSYSKAVRMQLDLDGLAVMLMFGTIVRVYGRTVSAS